MKVQQEGKESSMQGKVFVYLVGNIKKYDLMPSVMYQKNMWELKWQKLQDMN